MKFEAFERGTTSEYMEAMNLVEGEEEEERGGERGCWFHGIMAYGIN